MIDIKELKFDKNGLIPAVVVDADSGAVLTLAYMNAESLEVSIKEGKTCFWSRSRGELWRKGSSSGNVQHIIDIKTDCDKDALVVTVRKEGPACHTGADSCFINDVYAADHGKIKTATTSETAGVFSLKDLHNIILDRRRSAKPGSYTNYLFDKGIDKILKKFGEESVEVIIAAKAGDKGETVYELADLIYHAYVLMTQLEINPHDVITELASRHVTKEEN